MKDRDKKTLGKIVTLADYVATSAHKGRETAVDVSTLALH